MKRWNIQYILLYILRQRGIREEIRFAHPPTIGVYYHQPLTNQWGILPSTINQPVGCIPVNRQPLSILPSTINLPVGILPINKHLISGLCWRTGSNGPGTNFLKVAKHQNGVLENLPQQRLCCVNQHTSCTASTWMVDWAATRPCTLR